MPMPSNPMEIFKHLEKSNCRECGEKTCLAFAAAVYQSRKDISMCPKLDSKIIEFYAGPDDTPEAGQESGEAFTQGLLKALLEMNLAEAALRTGGRYTGRKLILKILGKDFGVDAKGNFSSDIHINHWVLGPFLDYVVHGSGAEPSGEWVSFRELKDGQNFTYPFFKKRCELPMKRIADNYIDLFDDLVHLFGGEKVAAQFESDVSVVLHPLPKVPIMICYLKPEDGLESTLNIYFDKATDHNLKNGTLFTICAGLANMFEKLSRRHAVFEAQAAGELNRNNFSSPGVLK